MTVGLWSIEAANMTRIGWDQGMLEIIAVYMNRVGLWIRVCLRWNKIDQRIRIRLKSTRVGMRIRVYLEMDEISRLGSGGGYFRSPFEYWN